MSTFDAKAIGRRICDARKTRSAGALTQAQLAERLGVSTRSVQNWEAGKIIPFPHMARIAEETGRSTRWLIYGDGNQDALEIAKDALEKIRRQNHSGK